MTTEINKEFETAVADGFKGTRSEFIASKKNKRNYLNEFGSICLTTLIIGALINLCIGVVVDYHINHKVSKFEYWSLIHISLLVSLMSLYNLFKPRDAK